MFSPDITTAKLAIKAFVADNGETSRTVKSDKTRVLLACKSNSCGFCIRAINSKKKGVLITHLEPHSCNPATHYIAPNTNALQFLIPYHQAAIIDNPNITAKQIQSNERLQYSNQIPCLQAYR